MAARDISWQQGVVIVGVSLTSDTSPTPLRQRLTSINIIYAQNPTVVSVNHFRVDILIGIVHNLTTKTKANIQREIKLIFLLMNEATVSTLSIEGHSGHLGMSLDKVKGLRGHVMSTSDRIMRTFQW